MERCRGCARSDGPKPWSSAFMADGRSGRPSLGSMLASVIPDVTVAPDDGLPSCFCADCARRLPEAFDFLKGCREADAFLRALNGAPNRSSMLVIKEEDIKPETEDTEESQQTDQVEVDITFNPRLRPKDTEGTETTYECSFCQKTFARKNDLKVHLRSHTGERPFACEVCAKAFAQSGTLIEHRRRHTGETPYACPDCERAFGSRASYWRHRRIHKDERPYVCEACPKSFRLSGALRQHRLVHERGESRDRHPCELCGKTVASAQSLRQHLTTHSNKRFVCELCGKGVSTKANLKTHLAKMHSEGAGRCERCGAQASDLKDHMLRHAAEPAFPCGVCRKSFRRRNALTFHMSAHLNAAKFECETPGCGRAFPKSTMLDYHTRKVHSNEVAHECTFCSKGYFRISDLTRHVNTSHATESAVKLKREPPSDT